MQFSMYNLLISAYAIKDCFVHSACASFTTGDSFSVAFQRLAFCKSFQAHLRRGALRTKQTENIYLLIKSPLSDKMISNKP